MDNFRKTVFNETMLRFLSIPSKSGDTKAFQDAMIDWLNERIKEGIDFRYDQDSLGNIFVKKGVTYNSKDPDNSKYVCLINHMDTVHRWPNPVKLNITWPDEVVYALDSTGKQVGVGADDKAGCAIALLTLLWSPCCKAVFFVDEEPGMKGSKGMHETTKRFFEDVKFGLSFDSPGRNRSARACSGVKLFNDEIFKILAPFAEDHGITKFNSEPYTDVLAIVDMDIPCWVVGNGGYNAHQETEYLKLSEARETCDLGLDFVEKFGKPDFVFPEFHKEEPKSLPPPEKGSVHLDFQDDPGFFGDMEDYIPVEVKNDQPNVVVGLDGTVICMAPDPYWAKAIADAINTYYDMMADDGLFDREWDLEHPDTKNPNQKELDLGL